MRFLVICNDFDFFVAHRKHVADRLVDEGHHVDIAVGGTIRAIDWPFAVIPLVVERRAFSPLSDVWLTWQLLNAIRSSRPDIIHSITMKPIVFTSLALLVTSSRRRRMHFVGTFPGLGALFDSDGALGHLRRRLAMAPLKRLTRTMSMRLTFENRSDRDELVGRGIVDEAQSEVVLGTGLDVSKFLSRPPKRKGLLTATWAGRMDSGKGLSLFRQAAQALAAHDPEIRFQVAGYPDPASADALSERDLNSVREDVNIDFLGHVLDMPELLAGTDIFVMPSRYREGMPAVLLEAAAAGSAIVASDTPGCRAVVRQDETGLILDEGLSAETVTKAIAMLARDDALRWRLGDAAREDAASRGFDKCSVQEHMLSIFECATRDV